MGLLTLMFLILMLVFSTGEIIRIDIANLLTVKPLDMGVLLIVLVWLLIKIYLKETKKIFKDKLFFPIFLFAVIGFVSLVLNFKHLTFMEAFVSFAYLFRWILYSFVYFVAKDLYSLNREKFFWIFYAAGSLVLLFGFIQYFFYSYLRNLYYLDWDEHMYRLFASFLDPNFAGAFFVLYFIFLSGICLYLLKNRQINLVILTTVVLLLTLLASYLTFSRSALLMLFASFFTFSILIKRAKLTIILVLVSLIFLLFSSKNFYIENINLFRVASSEARLDSAKNAIEIIRNNLLLGVGFNGYRYAQIRYGLRHGEGAVRSHADAGTDNSFLFILATTGFVGLISYLYLLFSILKTAYVNYRLTNRGHIGNVLSIIAIASFVGIIVDSFFINSLFYSFNMIWLWIVAGLLDSRSA